jgi:hypothetical protein
MRFLTKFAAAGLAAAATLALAGSAGAVIVGISAPTPDPKAAGADPLGDAFVTSVGGLSWTMGQEAFNTGSLTPGDGSPFATIFRFTINNGVVNGIDIDPSQTFFDDITTGKTWTAVFSGAGPTPNQRVEFTAPAGSRISPFDQFKIRVGFVTPLSPTRYSWSASWDNTVPEPATWALMIGGFGLAGVALRRRRTVAA